MKMLIGVAAVVLMMAVMMMAWRLSSTGSQSPLVPVPVTGAPQKPQPMPKAAVAPLAETASVPSTPAEVAQVVPTLEPQRRCAEVLAIANATERRAAFDKLMAETMDIAGIKAVLKTFTEMFKAGRPFDSEWRTFWRLVAHRDPQMAMALIDSYGPAEKWYAGAVSMAIQEWAGLDPQAAMSWLDANHTLSGPALDGATLNLIYGYATRDLRAATEYGLKVVGQDSPIFGDMAFALSRSAVQQGGTAGLFAWFEALPDDAVRTRLFPSISNRLGEIDPEQQRAWLAAQATMPWRNDDTYRNMLGSWAKSDPRAAMDFAVQLPRSPQSGQYVGLAYAAYEWLVIDPAAFAAYFNAIPPGELREGILAAIKQPLSDKNFPNRKREPAVRFLESVK